MNWLKATYQQYYGHEDINADAVTTGKTRNIGGITGRKEATGLGVFYATRQVLNHPQVCKNLGIEPGIKDKTFIIQGFGNVGYWASKFFVEEGGAKLVGVAEYDGSIYNENGINPDHLFEHKMAKKPIRSFPGGTSFED